MKLQKKRVKKKVHIIIAIVLLIFIYLNTYLLLKYNVLPTKYFVLYAIIFDIFPILMIMFTLFKKRKSKLKLVVTIFEFIYIIVLAIVFIYLNKTFNFLDRFTKGYNYETKNYYVITLKNSNFDDLKDLKNTKMGYTLGFGDSVSEALQKIENVIKFDKEKFDGYGEMLSALDNKEIESALILQTYYDMLHEGEDGNSLIDSENYKIIYKFSVREKTNSKIGKEVNVTKEPFTIYISGIDSYDSVTDNNRSDVNIVMSVNPKTKKVLLINIPRDYYVELSDVKQKDKLTHAGMHGVDVSVKTIGNLLDIDINYFVKVNYNALIKLVDALGGIDVYSAYNFSSYEYHYKFKEGMNHVDGKLALDFVRTRKAFKSGDRVRGENQQRMIEAIIKKVSSASILIKYDSFLKALDGNFATNISTNSIMSLINMQLETMPTWQVSKMSLNGTDSYEYTYADKNHELYVMIPKEESVNECIEALKENMK